MTTQKLEPHRFDAMTRSERGHAKTIWGAENIGRALNVSACTIYRWARRPEIPIHKVGGRYFATKADLLTMIQSGEPDERR